MNASASPSTVPASEASAARRAAGVNRFRWRVVDIVVASVIGVASGVLFWAWGQAWTPLSSVLAFLPGLEGLLSGGWLFAGVLGGLIIRKPGAALYTEIVAALVSMAVGTQWGFTTLIWGVVQGIGAELGFALFAYANYRLIAALVSGAFAGIAVGLLDTSFSSIAAYDIVPRAIYFAAAVTSGIVIAGLVSWLVMRALAATGALDRFAAGREARPSVVADPDAA